MATRRERVVLDVESNAVQKFAEAAAAAKLLSGELDSLSGRAVRSGRDLDRPAEGAERVGASARKAGPEIDQFSGRLRVLADAALILGPALVPLGASTIPVLTGSLAGLGAAAGGIGTAILAFQGLGDAIKAIDTYRLEPTAQNLEKMRLEAQKMGPAGMEMARYFANLEPVLRDLQNTAREGIFPGIRDGIDELLTRGPQVNRIISELAEGMGNIARNAGQSLAGDEWDRFFNYVETDARPILESFAASIGNVSLGVANMLVAFAPLSRDFTGGLEQMTKSFADWTAELDSNASFQEFVDYIRQSGPQAVEFLGAIAQAISGLLQAAAPVGSVVLPALTSLAQVFAAIASSPIGPGLYTAAAALVAFNRAALIANGAGTKLQATFAGMSRARLGTGIVGGLGLMAAAATDLDDKMGLANTTMGAMAGLMVGGPWGAAIGAAVGQMQDLNAATSEWKGNVEQANQAMRSGDTQAMVASLDLLQSQYDKLLADVPDNPFDFVATLLNPSKLQGSNEAMKHYADTISELRNSLNSGGDVGDLFAESIGEVGDAFRIAAGDAEEFSGALARLNGWFDKRDAVRGYKDALDDLRAGLKDGFTREDAAGLDAVGRSMLQVAENIKNPALRQDFLQGARSSLNSIAENAGPKAAAAIQEVINKFDDKGLTNPPKPKITVDDARAQATIKQNRRDLDILGRSISKPTVSGNDNPWKSIYGKTRRDVNSLDGMTGRPTLGARDQASGIIGQIIRALNGLDGKVATTYVRTIRQEFVNPQARANGGQVFGPGGPKDDKVPALLSNREFVQPVAAVDKYGIDFMESVRTLRFAEGGSPSGPVKGGGKAGTPPPMPWLAYFGAGVENAGKGLKGLKNALDKATEAQKKQTDAARDARDAAIGRRDALSSSIQQGLGANPWAEIAGSSATSGGNVWAAGAMAGTSSTGSMPATPASALAALQASTAKTRRFIAALNTLRQKGITGPVLQEIIGTGDVDRAEMMANLPIAELTQFSTAYTENQSALSAAGLAGGNAVEGANIAEANRALAQQVLELKQLQSNVRDVEKAIKQAEKEADESRKKHSEKNADDVGDKVNGGANKGRRNRVYASR